jgi:GNAT superfamily N-acetyltransferase
MMKQPVIYQNDGKKWRAMMNRTNNLTLRRYQSEEDYWRIRAFLRQVFLLNQRHTKSWEVYRFDYWRWHGIENLGDGRLEEDVFLWETTNGKIAAVLNREGPGQAFIQMHPDYQTPDLEEQIIATAEDNLMVTSDRDGKRAIWIWVEENDAVRQTVLIQQGYTKRPEENSGYVHRWDLSTPLPEVSVAKDYTVRALHGPKDIPARSWASFKGFHPDDPEDEYDGWEWYLNVQRAPLYRQNLDIVAVAPNGEFASFCTVWFDDVTRTGAFEPVATHPDHRRLGLATSVIHEGVHRLKRLGATLATVGAEESGTHAFYTKVGFTEWDAIEAWEKRI